MKIVIWKRKEFLRLIGVIIFMFQVTAISDDWAQLGATPGKTAYTRDQPTPPFQAGGCFDVWPEDRILSTIQVVTCKGKGFVGSKRGILYAFDLITMKEVWRFAAKGPILQTAAVIDDKVIFGSMDGCVYALCAEDGELIWKKDLNSKGITNAPLVLDEKIYLGTRGGSFVCIEPENGKISWRQEIDAPIMQSPAGGDGKIFFTAEDMKVRCLNAGNGKEIWRTKAFHDAPATLRGSHPVYYKGKVFQGGPSPYGNGYFSSLKEKSTPQIKPPDRKKTAFILAEKFPAKFKTWLKTYSQELEKNKYSPLLMVYDAEKGEILPSFPLAGTQSMATPLQAPTITHEGKLIYPLEYADWATNYGLFDCDTRKLEMVMITKLPVSRDETQNFSIGGNLFFTMHMWEDWPGTREAFNLKEKKRYSIRRAWPVKAGSEWKAAPPGNAVTIVGNRFYHVACDRVAVWKGEGKF